MDEFLIEFVVQQPQGRLLTVTVSQRKQRLLILDRFENAAARDFSIQLCNWSDTWLDRENRVAQWTASCDEMNLIIIIESLRRHAGAELGEVASPEFRRLFADAPRRLTRDVRSAIKAMIGARV